LILRFLIPSLSASLVTPSIRGLAFLLAFYHPVCPRWFSCMIYYLAFVLCVQPILTWLSYFLLPSQSHHTDDTLLPYTLKVHIHMHILNVRTRTQPQI
jgi:hypothetical protein